MLPTINAVSEVTLCGGTYPAGMSGLALMHSGAPLRLKTHVAHWHSPHFAALHTDLPRPLAAQPGRSEGDADAFNVRPTLGLSTAVVPHSALHLACTE